LKALFPEDSGIRVYISGCASLVVLEYENVFKLLSQPLPTRIGGLRDEIEEIFLAWEPTTLSLQPTVTPSVIYGAVIATEENKTILDTSCLRLCLRQCGSTSDVLTTITHAFVGLPKPLSQKTISEATISDLWSMIKVSIAQSRPIRSIASILLGAWALSFRKSCSPLGKKVYLANGTQEVGKILSMNFVS
jgi:hypothetical protein